MACAVQIGPVPQGIADKDAAQFFVNPVTAFAMLDTLALPRGAWLLQTAAGSILGRLVCAALPAS